MHAEAVLLANGSATGSGVFYAGGQTLFVVHGSFIAASLAVLTEAGNWLNVANAAAPGSAAVFLAPGTYRLTLAFGGTAVYASLKPVPRG